MVPPQPSHYRMHARKKKMQMGRRRYDGVYKCHSRDSSLKRRALRQWIAVAGCLLCLSPKPWETLALTPQLSCTRSDHTTRLFSSTKPLPASTQGLSRYVQNILSRTSDRQRFVTGKYPIVVSFEANPTQKWLQSANNKKNFVSSRLLVNNTLIGNEKYSSHLASWSLYQDGWLEEDERTELHQRYATVSWEWLAEIHVSKPGYVQLLPSEGAGASAQTTQHETRRGAWTNRWKATASTTSLEDCDDNNNNNNNSIQERLWISGFTLTGRKGLLQSMELESGAMTSLGDRTTKQVLWPNEMQAVPKSLTPRMHMEAESSRKRTGNLPTEAYAPQDALMISDGFLVPGKDSGGVYVVQNPGHPTAEWTRCLTMRSEENWFYHRAVFLDATGDGRLSILTARAKLKSTKPVPTTTRTTTTTTTTTTQTAALHAPTHIAGVLDPEDSLPMSNEKVKDFENRPKKGQLVLLECPKPYSYDPTTGTPLEADGTTFDPFDKRHLPWKEHVLIDGPDVMFSVADMDVTDNTVEVIASQFFDKKVTLHSIAIGSTPRVVFSRVIDDQCGSAFGGILAKLDPNLTFDRRQVLDSGSTVPCLRPGETFSHFLVTSHECNYSEPKTGASLKNRNSSPNANGRIKSIDGGSLFSYRVPCRHKDAWKTDPWLRTTVATGFKVDGKIWNVINPGAPGFCYTFHATRNDAALGKRPMIAVAGDCAESAYIFRPSRAEEDHGAPDGSDIYAQYKLMCEIKCDATVGSLAIGYDDLLDANQQPGYAKIYIPCYEKDRILVFALGSGETEEDTFVDDDGW